MALIDWNSETGKQALRSLLKQLAFRPVRKSIGWVNVYRDTYGNLHMSCRPKPTRKAAHDSRASNPTGTYLDTIELFAETSANV